MHTREVFLYLDYKLVLHNINMNSKIYTDNYIFFLMTLNNKQKTMEFEQETGRKEKALHFAIFNDIFLLFKHRVPHFNFALDSTNDKANPSTSFQIEKVEYV